MAKTKVDIPGFQEQHGEAPIIILGPNGSGKTKLAQRIAQSNKVSAISAQRRTWVDDNLPVQEEQQLRNNVRSQQNQWQNHSWQPTEDINFILSSLIQEHTNQLSKRNEEAIAAEKALDPVKDTKLILLQALWKALFPKRKLEIGGFFPTVTRLDAAPNASPYRLREMSDGERTVLYMAARVLTADQPIILVDEPELHMHSRLSVQFWNEAEDLRPDCRFVYVTHDLNFTLSRRNGVVLIARPDGATEVVAVDAFPSSVASEILGAATLPFYARRIFLFEGESGAGFADEFFSAWFDGAETFSVPAGDRDSVCAAVSGLKAVGVVAADVVGLVDRDFYSDEALACVPVGVTVLPVHEIESVLCDERVVAALAEYLGKDPATVWDEFLKRVRSEYRGKTLSAVIARRVRSRVGDLLNGAFSGGQVVADLEQTKVNHGDTIRSLDLPAKTSKMFEEESERVERSLKSGDKEILALLPGKHLLNMLSGVLGFSRSTELIGLVTRSLHREAPSDIGPLRAVGVKLEQALVTYLPPRRAELI